MTSWIAGIDGFRRGWFAVLVNHSQGRVIETCHHVSRRAGFIEDPPCRG